MRRSTEGSDCIVRLKKHQAFPSVFPVRLNVELIANVAWLILPDHVCCLSQ